MKVGFIGLGNVGGKLAGSLSRNGYDLMVRDLDAEVARPFVEDGAEFADSPKARGVTGVRFERCSGKR